MARPSGHSRDIEPEPVVAKTGGGGRSTPRRPYGAPPWRRGARWRFDARHRFAGLLVAGVCLTLLVVIGAEAMLRAYLMVLAACGAVLGLISAVMISMVVFGALRHRAAGRSAAASGDDRASRHARGRSFLRPRWQLWVALGALGVGFFAAPLILAVVLLLAITSLVVWTGEWLVSHRRR